MATRGRKPKPAAVHEMNGNPGRRRHDGELRLPANTPDPPADLPEAVKAQWDRAVALLAPTGVLTVLDGLALLVLCRAAADYLAACEKVKPGDDVLDGCRNLMASARDKAEARLLKMLCEFGMTPSSRARLRAPPPAGNSDPLEKLLHGQGTDN